MPANKIDSNATGLAIAYENSIGVLPGTPVWYPLEPNSYSGFGSTVATTPRNPISKSRQRKKGFVTDLDANGGFNQDLTQSNLTRHLQGFMFADIKEKATTAPMNAAGVTITGVTTSYNAAAGLGGFAVNNLIKASGFGNSANNGLKVLTAATATALTAAGVAAETPPAGHKIEKVGHRFAASDIAFSAVGGLARMTSTANACTALGLIPGEWVYVGGDNAANTPTTAKGWARASVVTAGYIEFDKCDWTPATDAATGKLVDVYIGSLLRTEEDPAFQVRRTATLERSLGVPNGAGTQGEYISGACFNTLAINMPQADKVTMDLGFVATNSYTRTDVQGLLTGTRVVETATDAFNTSSDFSRIKMSLVDAANANVTPLFAYMMDLTLNISNNVSPNKALGTLGAFDTTAGMFTADGSLTAYFVDTASTLAVRNNSDVTLDIILAKNNAAQLIDLPLISLGNGILNVEPDQPITIPLDTMAAQSKFGHTMVYQNFPYVPTAAT